jgi:hypothetical protein
MQNPIKPFIKTMLKSTSRLRPVFMFLLLLAGSLCFIFAMPAPNGPFHKNTLSAAPAMPVANTVSNSLSAYKMLYDSLELNTLQLSREAFDYAVQGFYQLQQTGMIQEHILTIADFSLPSTKKRLFIIDMANARLLMNTFVAHGRNSGKVMATQFSNKLNSFKSSLGFYITSNTYRGEHGYSLRLEGVEKGINDNAFDRNIVLHGADYVNEKYIARKGYIGRSLGCPAVPHKLHTTIIDLVKGGTCLFLYSPDKYYTTHSPVLKQFIG